MMVTLTGSRAVKEPAVAPKFWQEKSRDVIVLDYEVLSRYLDTVKAYFFVGQVFSLADTRDATMAAIGSSE